MLSGQITTWLLHVHDHLLRLNAAAYSLEMSENIGNFIWLICLKVTIGKRFFLLLIVSWSAMDYLTPFGPCLMSVSHWFLFVYPQGTLLLFHLWLNILFWNSGIGCKRDLNRFLLALKTESTILLGKINDELLCMILVCLAGVRVLGGLLSIPSLEEIPSPSRLVQWSILTLSINTFVI